MENIVLGLTNWIKEIIERTVNELVQAKLEEMYAELWNKQKVLEKLDVSSRTFDEYFRYDPNFPKELPCTRWRKYEIIAWMNGKY